MNMKLKRSIAMLLLVCTLVSLLGIGAFATGGEGAPETISQGEAQTATSAAATPSPTLNPEPTPAANPNDGYGGDETSRYTLIFYGYDGSELCKIENHAAGALTTGDSSELATLEAELPSGGIAYWYGTDGTNRVTYTHDQLKGAELAANYSFYAAYLVTYTDASGNEISTEIVKAGGTPASVPTQTNGTPATAITGWTDTTGKDVTPGETTVRQNTTFMAKTTPPVTNVKLTFYDYDGTTVLSTIDHESGKAIATSEVPASKDPKDAAVMGWFMKVGDTETEVYDITTVTPAADTAFYAAWRVTYLSTDGTTETGKELVRKDGTLAKIPATVTVNGSAVTPAGWKNEQGTDTALNKLVVTGNATYTAWLRPTLVTDKSVAYVKGSSDKNGNVYRFLPNGKLTRAEAAQLLYGLLPSSAKEAYGPVDVTFADVVKPGTTGAVWYAKAIYTLASYGLLSGTGNNKFDPTREITRAEFIIMATRIYGIKTSTKPCPFTDVSSTKPYYNAVMTAYENGWIHGYEESGSYTFEAQRMLTRAEAVSILNRVVGRSPSTEDKARIDAYDWRIFIDVDTNWAYYDIMQAATGCGQSIPNTGLSEGRHSFALNGVNTYFFVNADKRFVAVSAGLNKMSDGKTYYFPTKGAGAPVYGEGLRILGGKLYLLSSDGSAITEPKSGYDTRVYDYKGQMYYIQTDGSLLRNGYFGQLYFGENGAYTSGDKVLDTWVNNFINSHSSIGNASTQENKLYAAYVALRDFPKERYGYGSAGYWRYDLRTYTDQEHASLFYERARGSCEEWAYAMTYLARRIGYKAAGASGKLGGQRNAIHVWEVIEIRGTLYTFDVEQEWGFMYKYYNSKLRTDRDCWKMTYAPSKSINYGTRFAGTTYGSYYAGRTNIWSPYVYNRSTSSLGF